MTKRLPVAILLITLLATFSTALGEGTTPPPAVGNVPSMGDLLKVVDKAANEHDSNKDWSTPVKMVIIFAGLAILPSLMVMMTSFTRIVIVLSFVRRALTTQNIPPTIAIIGLSLFLTMYTMAPTFAKINETAIKPYLAEQIGFDQAWTDSSRALKGFMLAQCRETDLGLFMEMANAIMPEEPLDIGLHIVVPAFIISEFRTAFEIGCLLFIPFLLIDLVTANILLSAGMMMLPPAMISLPFKLILFILVDGWALLAKSLCMGFNLTG
ncbi:MAG: flagellar type III secretion system pore protein FliP [Anaerohalosphaera sp.]|nr:flagellar type III secretion system pore protein FliP [Anaerohalosphaera sp.]